MKTTTKTLLLLPLCFCLFGLSAGVSVAEVNVNIGVFAPPPPLVIEDPPVMAVAYGTPYVYFAPDVTVGLFFYGGHWYRPHGGRWFRARSYRGPWAYVHGPSVPPALVRLPPDYRNIPRGQRTVPYGQMKKEWKTWEQERHWDNRAGGPPAHKTRYEKREPPAGYGGRNNHGGGPRR